MLPLPLPLEVGAYYRTAGGWHARVDYYPPHPSRTVRVRHFHPYGELDEWHLQDGTHHDERQAAKRSPWDLVERLDDPE